MLEGDRFHHAAAALRPALIGRPLIGFFTPGLDGPPPRLGRVVEGVEVEGRRVLMRFDDGLVIDSQFRSPYLAAVGRRPAGLWHLHRDENYGGVAQRDLGLALSVTGWTAACFHAVSLESYRAPDVRRHPSLGGQGPDVSRPGADLGRVVNALMSYPDPETSMAEVLSDERVFHGVGSVYLSEVLWATRLHPDALIGALPQRDLMSLVHAAARLLTSRLDQGARVAAAQGFAVHARNGQGCARCHDTVEVVPLGSSDQVVYWCPGCQTRHDPVRAGLRRAAQTITDPRARPSTESLRLGP